MARRKSGVAIDGWLVIDKPEGMSSAAVVGKVRRLTNARKAGHAGTLDPMATGVLPIALGEATKTVDNVMNGGKRYEFTVRWGAETTTGRPRGRCRRDQRCPPRSGGDRGRPAPLHWRDRTDAAGLFGTEG